MSMFYHRGDTTYHRGDSTFDKALRALAKKIQDEVAATCDDLKDEDWRDIFDRVAIFSGTPGRCRLVTDHEISQEAGNLGRCDPCQHWEECKNHLAKNKVALSQEDFDSGNARNVPPMWIVLSSRECRGIKAMFESEEGCIAGVLFEPDPNVADSRVLLDDLNLYKIIAPGLKIMIEGAKTGRPVKECARDALEKIEASFLHEIEQEGNMIIKGALARWLSSLVTRPGE